jgi:hypothetical protein
MDKSKKHLVEKCIDFATLDWNKPLPVRPCFVPSKSPII